MMTRRYDRFEEYLILQVQLSMEVQNERKKYMEHIRPAFIAVDIISRRRRNGTSAFLPTCVSVFCQCDVRRGTRGTSLREPRRQPSRNRLSREMEAAAVTTRRRQSASLVAPRARGAAGRERREIASEACKEKERARRGEAR